MITEISDNFYRMTLPMPFRLRHVHAYVLVDGEDIALFDTGMHMPGAYEKMEADIKSIGLSVESIRDIYITHTHTDHCGLAEEIQKKSNARLHLSEVSHQVHSHFLEAGNMIAQARVFFARQGLPPSEIEAIVAEIQEISARTPRFAVNTFLRNNQIRRFGNRSFEVIFTPGHAAGHVCFFFRDENLLLAGDHVLPYIAPSLSPHIHDDVFEPLKSYLESLEIIDKLPITTIYSGHGNSFSGVDERIQEIRTHHTLKKQALLKSIGADPKTPYAICGEMLAGTTAHRDDWEKFMTLNETCVYLQDLKRDGAVQESLINGMLCYIAA